MTSNHSVGNCSMLPIDLSTIPDNITDKVTNSNHKPTKSLLSMKPPGMSNVQYCWSARILTNTPSPDNADDELLDEMTTRDKLDMEGLLEYQESQAHHVEKFTRAEQVKLASAREKYDSYRSVIDSGKNALLLLLLPHSSLIVIVILQQMKLNYLRILMELSNLHLNQSNCYQVHLMKKVT